MAPSVGNYSPAWSSFPWVKGERFHVVSVSSSVKPHRLGSFTTRSTKSIVSHVIIEHRLVETDHPQLLALIACWITAKMSPTPVTPTGRTRCCLACPGGENVTPKSAVSQPSPSYGSMGRTLGHRSLDAVRSVRGSIKGRRALNTATNGITATSSSSCSSSPVGSATKQRWYDSIRSRSSQIPMPSSPASSSPTLKRRLFKAVTDGNDKKMLDVTACESDISPTILARPQRHAQAQTLRTPLPKLDLPALDPDLRRTTTFRACSEKVIQGLH